MYCTHSDSPSYAAVRANAHYRPAPHSANPKRLGNGTEIKCGVAIPDGRTYWQQASEADRNYNHERGEFYNGYRPREYSHDRGEYPQIILSWESRSKIHQADCKALQGEANARYDAFKANDRRPTFDDIRCGYNIVETILDIRPHQFLSHSELKIRYLGGTEKWVPDYAVKGPEDKIASAIAALSDTPNSDAYLKLREKLAKVKPEDAYKLPLSERREWVIMQMEKHWLKQRLSRNVISDEPSPPDAPASNPVKRAA